MLLTLDEMSEWRDMWKILHQCDDSLCYCFSWGFSMKFLFALLVLGLGFGILSVLHVLQVEISVYFGGRQDERGFLKREK